MIVARSALAIAACAAVFSARAEELDAAVKPPIPYLAPAYAEDGSFTGLVERTCSNYTLIGETTYSSNLNLLDDGWYVVSNAAQSVEIKGILDILGKDVHLIVCNRQKLSAHSIHVPMLNDNERKLSIYAQTADTNLMGRISNTAQTQTVGCAGIGSYDEVGVGCGVIEINGCKIEVWAGGGAAGIGGGRKNKCTAITINGGHVTAYGNDRGPGIGVGQECDDVSGSITINGGTVIARGGDCAAGIGGGYDAGCPAVTINGGTVDAMGWYGGAGIGTGQHDNLVLPNIFALSIVINGGTVLADGGRGGVYPDSHEGAGIGGGLRCMVGGIVINGGTVKAYGGAGGGAGIGAGLYGCSAGVLITGGSVFAEAREHGAGIGGGGIASMLYVGGIGAAISISGGKVTANGSSKGAGIGGGDGKYTDISVGGTGLAISISGDAEVTATGGAGGGAGIGGGRTGNGCYIAISGSNAVVRARGGQSAAGIGGGWHGEGDCISISGGDVEARGGSYGAGIGGGDAGRGYEIEVTGGKVRGYGGENGAGVGGGCDSTGSCIRIAGGYVLATGGAHAAGIGGGDNGGGADIEISGGEVNAFGHGEKEIGLVSGAGVGGGRHKGGSNIRISGGKVRAQADGGAAGIGGGGEPHGTAANIEITGGDVEAIGGVKGAGIGGGASNGLFRDTIYDREIFISGGTVKATGGPAAPGIGGGYNRDVKKVCISGGTVEAIGGEKGAGIGGAFKSQVVGLTICGGKVTAKGGLAGAGVGCGWEGTMDRLVISNGLVRAICGPQGGAAIGGGCNSAVRNLHIYGGDVTAVPNDADSLGGGAGIGGGDSGSIDGLFIHGGTVSATGGKWGAGIGCGDRGKLYNLLIEGGQVQAQGGYGGAGIGAGEKGTADCLTFSGGRVVATTACAASGIGRGADASSVAKIHFTGGTVKARTLYGNKPDISGEKVQIDGGSIDARSVKRPPYNKYDNELGKVVFTNVVEVPPVTVVGLPNGYGVKDLYPDATNTLYLWLLKGAGYGANTVTVGTKKYRYCVCGDVTYAKELTDPVPVTVNGKVYTALDRAKDGCAFTNGVLSIYDDKRSYAIVGYMTNSEVRVEVVSNATVTLDNLWLESYQPSNSLIKVAKGSTLTLKLKGVNMLWANAARYSLTESNSCCGIEVPEGAGLKIDSAVSGDDLRILSVIPSGYAAGIGGRCGMRNGTIEVLGGTIGVLMGQEEKDEFGCGAGAGIGAGANSNNGPIVIRGGSVTVARTALGGRTLAQTGAGIGSGGVPAGGAADTRVAGEVILSGGAEIAAEAGLGAGIGSGARNAAVNVTISPTAFVTAQASRGAGIGAGASAQGVSVAITNLTGETVSAASMGLVTTYASDKASGIGSGVLANDEGSDSFRVKIGGGRIVAHESGDSNVVSAVAIGYGSTNKLEAAISIQIDDGTVSADSIGRNDGIDSFSDVKIGGGSVMATLVNGAERPKNAVNADGEDVLPITVDGRWTDGTYIVLEDFDDDYGCRALFAVNGKIILWGSDEEYEFTTTDDATKQKYDWKATVDGTPTDAVRANAVGVSVNGEDLVWGEGEGWSYQGNVLTLKDGYASVVKGQGAVGELYLDIHGDADVTLDTLTLGDGSDTTTNLVTIAENMVNLSIVNGATFAPGANFSTFGILSGAVLNCIGEFATKVSIDYYGGYLTLANPSAITFTSQEAAEKAAQSVLISPLNDDIAAVVDAETYASYFTVYAKGSGDNGWTLDYAFTDDTTNQIHAAIESQTALKGLAATVTNDAPTTIVETLPGLYYGMAGSTNVTEIGTNGKVGGWVLGDGTKREITGEQPKGTTNGAFYQLRVSCLPE